MEKYHSTSLAKRGRGGVGPRWYGEGGRKSPKEDGEGGGEAMGKDCGFLLAQWF